MKEIFELNRILTSDEILYYSAMLKTQCDVPKSTLAKLCFHYVAMLIKYHAMSPITCAVM